MEVEDCPLPEDRWYDRSLELWLRPEPDGTARIGMTAAWSAFLGRILRVEYRTPEGIQTRGWSLATVESARTAVPFRLPLDAEILAPNPRLRDHPRRINDDPYGDGWIAHLRPRRPVEAEVGLATASEIREAMIEQIRRRRIQCWPVAPEREMVEIGLECSAIFARLDEELARLAPGEAIVLVTDDPTSPIEMARWTDRTGQRVRASRRTENLYKFLVQRAERPAPRRRSASGELGPGPD
ncbi:MAG: sulfurtransferase TusA family protein [Thermoplasmata archaeon]